MKDDDPSRHQTEHHNTLQGQMTRTIHCLLKSLQVQNYLGYVDSVNQQIWKNLASDSVSLPTKSSLPTKTNKKQPELTQFCAKKTAELQQLLIHQSF